MISVTFERMRNDVKFALACLADLDYQQAAWIERTTQYSAGDFTANVNILYDDCCVLPDPTERIGSVLLEGEEILRLLSLNEVLETLIDELGEAPDSEYLSDARWAQVIVRAGAALSAMVRAELR